MLPSLKTLSLGARGERHTNIGKSLSELAHSKGCSVDTLNRSSLMATFFSLLSDRAKLRRTLPLLRAGIEGLRLATVRLEDHLGDTDSALEFRTLANHIEASAETLKLEFLSEEDEMAELAAEREGLAIWQLIVHDDEPIISTLRRLMALAEDDLETARRPNDPRTRLRVV